MSWQNHFEDFQDWLHEFKRKRISEKLRDEKFSDKLQCALRQTESSEVYFLLATFIFTKNALCDAISTPFINNDSKIRIAEQIYFFIDVGAEHLLSSDLLLEELVTTCLDKRWGNFLTDLLNHRYFQDYKSIFLMTKESRDIEKAWVQHAFKNSILHAIKNNLSDAIRFLLDHPLFPRIAFCNAIHWWCLYSSQKNQEMLKIILDHPSIIVGKEHFPLGLVKMIQNPRKWEVICFHEKFDANWFDWSDFIRQLDVKLDRNVSEKYREQCSMVMDILNELELKRKKRSI